MVGATVALQHPPQQLADILGIRVARMDLDGFRALYLPRSQRLFLAPLLKGTERERALVSAAAHVLMPQELEPQDAYFYGDQVMPAYHTPLAARIDALVHAYFRARPTRVATYA